MYFYEISLLKSPLSALTYQSEEELFEGINVEVSIRNRKKLSAGVVTKIVEKPSFKCTNIGSITPFYHDKKMLETAKFISMYYVCSLGEALSLYTPFSKENEEEKEEEKEEEEKKLFDCKILLSKEQEEAYDFCEEKKQALLFANTGSGKTEVYIKTIEKHLNNGSQAVLLMPEISLTPQMQNRLESSFGDAVAIWHSKVTKKKKALIIENLLNGKIKLIAGARSALFLPYKNLSCIIVDEEHDESYKADSKPRYNLKDLTIYYAKKNKIQLILGSATPSITSFHKIPYIRIKKTFYETNKKFYFDNSTDTMSDAIKNKIAKTINEGHQVIVFLPTRANYKYQICSSCGKSVECPFCSVAMSLHKNALALKCHYCNYAQKIPNSCPSCEIGIIKNFRVGTAQIQEELNHTFPEKNIERFDRDVIKTDKQLREILNNFNSEKIDILVGTQMLSKGHDYHNVKLAVVFGIDSVLNMSSFKARERALSLLIQISGRSGRKGLGEVIVQTKNQDFFEYCLLKQDYEEFLKEELEYREDLYPPFYKLAKVTFASTNAFKSKAEMDKYVSYLRNIKDIEVVGFGESGIFKIANKYRYEITLRSNKINPLLSALHSIQSDIAIIDMDTNY